MKRSIAIICASLMLVSCSKSPGEELLAVCAEHAPDRQECLCMVEEAEARLSPELMGTLAEVVRAEEDKALDVLSGLDPDKSAEMVAFVVTADAKCTQ